MTLEQLLNNAYDREVNDDHLDNDEREALVRRYRTERPLETLPSDMQEAYIEIVLG